MLTEQVQWHCNNCRCPTLHVRMTEECPHLIHAIVTCFLCGLWLPVWIVHSILTDSANQRRDWPCNRCGQPAGTGGRFVPPVQHAAVVPAVVVIPTASALPSPTGAPTMSRGSPAQQPPKAPPPSGKVTGGWG